MSKRSDSDEAGPMSTGQYRQQQQAKLADLLSHIPTKWVVVITVVLATGGNQALAPALTALGLKPAMENTATIEAKLDNIVEHQNETHRELDLTLAALPKSIADAIAEAIAPIQQRLEDNTVDIRVLQALGGIEPGGGSG